MKKLFFLIIATMFCLAIKAQQYVRAKALNELGDTVLVWVPVSSVSNSSNNTSEEKLTRRERKTERRRDYTLDKLEVKQDHALDMKKEDTKQVEAKANGGRWEKNEKIYMIGGNSGFGNYPFFPNVINSSSYPIMGSSFNPNVTVYTGYVPTGNQTGYFIAHKL